MKVPFSIRQFLDRAALVYRDCPAVTDEPQKPGSLGTLTYGDVFKRSGALARRLEVLGTVPGDRIAVISKNSARFFISFFGICGFGRIIVPVNYRLNHKEMVYLLRHSGASVLLCDPEFSGLASEQPGMSCIVLDGGHDSDLFDYSGTPAPWEADEDFPASINYTSGTTALPKGVVLTHRNLWLNAVVSGLHLGVRPKEVYLHTLPMFHCNGWGMPFLVSGLGGHHIIQESVRGEEILSRVEEHGVTLMCGAPTVLKKVLNAYQESGGPPPGAGRVRVVVAGAPPSEDVIRGVEENLGWEFIQIYGLTETAPLLTYQKISEEQNFLTPSDRYRQLAKAGMPALGVTLKRGKDGEVLARGNMVMDHYWRDPEATAAAIKEGYFHTGDQGDFSDDGMLTLTDRIKDIIISGGENISSVEVERVLCSHPEISEACVVGTPDEKWGELVTAHLVLKPGSRTKGEAVIAYCRERLAHYKCPKKVLYHSTLPWTATGKLQKYRFRNHGS